MSIWAIGDLHLPIGGDKIMADFGKQWDNHAEKIAKNWKKKIVSEDLVLIPGDLCWANKIEDAIPAFNWLDNLPGTKVLIKGNHDNWWVGNERLQNILPKTIYAIKNNALVIDDVFIAGSKGWTYAINEDKAHRDKMLFREYKRMRLSLDAWPKEGGRHRILMTHYPPFDHRVEDKRFLELLDEYRVDLCIFGHLHGGDACAFRNFSYNERKIVLTSADKLDFSPIKLYNTNVNNDNARYVN